MEQADEVVIRGIFPFLGDPEMLREIARYYGRSVRNSGIFRHRAPPHSDHLSKSPLKSFEDCYAHNPNSRTSRQEEEETDW